MAITYVPPEYFKSFRNDRQIEEGKNDVRNQYIKLEILW